MVSRCGRHRTAAAVLIAALAISACGSSSSSQTGPAASPSKSASASTTTTTTTSTQSTPTAAATPNAVGASTCLTSHLRLSLASGGGAAGTAYLWYDLTNAGSTACSMIGYPGVSVLDAHGHIVQHPARRGAALPAPVRLVTVRPGQRAKFLINSTDVIPSPGCPRPYAGSTLQVYPPNQKKAILQAHSGAFCNLRVGPVQRAG